MGEEVIAAAQTPVWIVIVAPFLGAALTGGLLYVALRGDFRERRHDRAIRQAREARWSLGADVALGREANPDTGAERIIGLRETVPQMERNVQKIAATIGHRNGDGKTVMDHVTDTAAKMDELKVGQDRVERGQQDLASRLTNHEGSDNDRFAAVTSAVESVRSTLADVIESR